MIASRPLTLATVLWTATTLRAQPASSAEDAGVTFNPSFPKADAIRSIMQSYSGKGLPGVALALYSMEYGWWGHAEGYADVKRMTSMRLENLQYLQSISKTYMAVAILRLKEEGKIDFDAPMTQYLSTDISRYIADTAKITVKMLLNHTSCQVLHRPPTVPRSFPTRGKNPLPREISLIRGAPR
jgi:D-alanyl-D-alanine carboxypeptidase